MVRPQRIASPVESRLRGHPVPLCFDLSISDGLHAWTLNVAEDEVRERASQWDQPASEFIELAERHLGFQQPGSVYGFTDAGNGHRSLSWSFEKEGTKLEWRWKCKPSPNDKETTAGILDFVMDANVRLSDEVVWKTQSFNKPRVEAEKCLAQSERFSNEKTEFEDAIYAKIKREHSRELNPYLKNNGSGYPEVEDGKKARVSSSVVGDGGASWRLKALKRAQEQAAREGQNLKEVVEERWGSVGQLAVSVASCKAASSHAHLHAIHNRKRGLPGEHQTVVDDHNEKIPGKNTDRESMRDVSCQRSEMKVPKLFDSLSWGKQKRQTMSSKDSGLISSTLSSLNRFANDGSFMHEVTCQKDDEPGGSVGSPNRERKVESESVPSASFTVVNEGLSANQLAAKALQLRLKGKHEEAEKLMKEAENVKAKHVAEDESSRPPSERNTRRYTMHDTSIRQRKKEDDADMHLAQKIVQNKKFSTSAQADDEYDFDDGPRRKAKKKGGTDQKLNEKTNFSTRILTQQERCKFCFENPNRPRHLVVAIANFTYLNLPHLQSVAAGHCCILTLQHESATRAVDDNVWDEIRNFKKCLIMMFAKQEKDVVFLETVMGLAQQRRHCLVECIPLPQDIAKQAPLYFKKAIDEAEDEWSQHNSKKLIDTSLHGLRGSVPKDFPYFHVEFGLNKGFVHVIDDEQQFEANFGLNVIRGMLKLPEEDIYGRRKHDSQETQKQAVSSFARDWAPFDWTKQLE
ncbi:uncharacterized protein LOC131332590 [Rhododendron vialii]|uniref:uncharacterized protein LOC131332590 n=1 Tax=Rhododendron vialii TaxID=182163 RepID=UPI00265EAFD9|nr:uncharacterized protein LOC131332590 [Rhododendron vialii]